MKIAFESNISTYEETEIFPISFNDQPRGNQRGIN